MKKYTPFLVALLLLVLTFGAVSYAPSVALAQDDVPPIESTNSEETGEAVSYTNPQTIQQTTGFWTPERLAAAQPVPEWAFQRSTSTTNYQASEIEMLANGPAMVSSPVLPGTGGNGSAPVEYQVPGGSTTTPSFTYPFAYNVGLVTPAFYGFYPWRVNGKIFFTNSAYGAGTFVCSGTIVTSGDGGNQNLVLTAAHCVNSGGNGTTGGTWSQNVVFHPGYSDGSSPQGAWPYYNLWVQTNWATHSNQRQDYAFIETNQIGRPCGSLTNCFGAQGVAWNQAQLREFWATGYPAASPYDGQRMILCTASTARRDTSIPGAGSYPQGEVPMGIGCNMTGGSSGGSWVIRGNMSNGGFANSVNSYKYVSPAQPNAMYGPYFDGNFYSLWNAARP